MAGDAQSAAASASPPFHAIASCWFLDPLSVGSWSPFNRQSLIIEVKEGKERREGMTARDL